MAPRPESQIENKEYSFEDEIKCLLRSSGRIISQSDSSGNNASSSSSGSNWTMGNKKSKIRVGDEILVDSGSRLKIKEKLGCGTYGQVFKIKTSGHYLALKAVKIDNEALRESALREVEILNYMRQVDMGEFILEHFLSFDLENTRETTLCHVSQMLQKPLADILDKIRGNAFHPKIVKVIGFQLLSALERLHALGITHCDIKPDNVMFVDINTQKLRVKLIDFGNSSYTFQLRRGFKIQNLMYRSPEVLFGLPLNEKLDIWGVGCILFEMFTGEDLFPVDEEPQLVRFMREMVGLPDGVENGTRSPRFLLPDEETGGLRPITYKESKFVGIKDSKLDTRKIRNLCGIPQMGYNYRCGLGISMEDYQFEEILISMLAVDVDARKGAAEALQSLFFRSFDGNFNPYTDGKPYTRDVELTEN